MTDIDEVRARLELAFAINGAGQAKRDVAALLADHARLQADAGRLDWLESTVHDADIPGAVQLYFGPYGASTLRAAIDAAKAVAVVTTSIIPAGEWPEDANHHCWDAGGQGYFYGSVIRTSSIWLPVVQASDVPMPAGHDWRVPVMRPDRGNPVSPPAIDLRQYAVAIQYAINGLREAGGKTDGVVAQKLGSLLALIGGQASENSVRVDRGALQMAINVLRRAGKGEVANALAGGVIDEQVSRSDWQIVEQTEELAHLLLGEIYQREAPAEWKFREQDDPHSRHVWQVACRVQEMLTDTDPENAVSELDGEQPNKGEVK